jgi:hypothetical protein
LQYPHTPEVELAISSLRGFTYFKVSKDFAIPSKHIKTSCLPPMSICNTLTQGGDNYFNLALINFASMNKTKFHAILSHFIIS